MSEEQKVDLVRDYVKMSGLDRDTERAGPSSKRQRTSAEERDASPPQPSTPPKRPPAPAALPPPPVASTSRVQVQVDKKFLWYTQHCFKQYLENTTAIASAWIDGALSLVKSSEAKTKLLFEEAARRGYLDNFTDHEESKGLWDAFTCSAAADGGHLRVLKYLHESGCPWDEWTCSNAAFGGHLDVLRWCRAFGCPWNVITCQNAAEGGHLDVLKWLRSQDPPCPWDWETSYFAEIKGKTEVLAWLRKEGCPYIANSTLQLSEAQLKDHVESERRKGKITADWLLTFVGALEEGEKGKRKVLMNALAECEGYGHLAKGFRLETCHNAAENGHLDVLKWVRSQDPPCPWDEETCDYATYHGHLDVLKWLRSQDPPCPWDEYACHEAASNGHLDVLKWLRSQDPPCPWNEGTCCDAASKGHLDVLKWSIDNGCPYDVSLGGKSAYEKL